MYLDNFDGMLEKPRFESSPVGYSLRLTADGSRWMWFCDRGYSEAILPTKMESLIPLPSDDELGSGSSENGNLNGARSRKYDEYYTRLEDIEKEVGHYRSELVGKTVYCPCDRAWNFKRSQFFSYFSSHFKELGIKKLVCTQYNKNGSGIVADLSSCDAHSFDTRGVKWEWSGENGGCSEPDESEIPTEFLQGDGSFDSDECKAIMLGENGDGSDVVVVTNPPFSKFREFMSQVVECGCKFLIIGSKHSITYKNVFQYIVDGKMWLGARKMSGSMFFDVTEDHERKAGEGKLKGEWKIVDGKRLAGVGVVWYTNMEHDGQKRKLELTKEYIGNENCYPRLVNLDGAIDIGHFSKNGKWEGCLEMMPKDYSGPMSVPITFLEFYNPKQFEIVGSPDAGVYPTGWKSVGEEFSNVFNGQQDGKTVSPKSTSTATVLSNGKAVLLFKRIIVKMRAG